MNFGEAIAALKRGDRVARSGWNGKGMWIALVHPERGDLLVYPPSPHTERYSIDFRTVMDEEFRAPCLAYATPRLLPWIGMKTADDCFVPWLASQTDILAEDWGLVDG